jgi:hypothetical protein
MQFITGRALDAVLDEMRRHAQANPTVTERNPQGLSQATQVRNPTEAGERRGVSPPVGTQHRRADAAPLANQESYWLTVARLGLQVAEALAYAHAQGTLHRDIKPANLLLDPQGVVWVTDFGLAKAVNNSDLTGTGEIVGTLRYIPPERFHGTSDARGDIYSLGLTLHEMITLRPAFDAEDRLQLIQQILHSDPPPPRRANPRVPRDLETIVLKASARDAHQRYASADALAEDLRLFLADRPVKARRVSWIAHAVRWCRRNPAVAGLSGSLLFLIAAVSVGSTTAAILFLAQRDEAIAAKKEAQNLYQALEFSKTLFPEPKNLLGFGGKVGESYHFRVTGSRSGTVIGTDVYAERSAFAATVVHAGAIKVGESGYVRVTFLPKQTVYLGTRRHDVASDTTGQLGESNSYRVEPIDHHGNLGVAQLPPRSKINVLRPPAEGSMVNFRGLHGQSFIFELTASDRGAVRGTDVYTDDSALATAAVHAGILKVGQTDTVRVTMQPGPRLFPGTNRQGVQSETMKLVSQSGFTMQRVDGQGQALEPAVVTRSDNLPMKPPPDDGSLANLRGPYEGEFLIEVTAWPSRMKSVWGTDTYTLDSSLAAAAVHAGLLRPNHRAVIRATLLPGQQSYKGTTRHGVESKDYVEFEGSVRLTLAAEFGKPVDVGDEPGGAGPAPQTPDVANITLLRGKNGQSIELDVVGEGQSAGMVWGTDTYTDDSWLPTAAVHAGLLSVGEKGRIKVTILAGKDSYQGSSRNGIVSSDFAFWGGSYRLERVYNK